MSSDQFAEILNAIERDISKQSDNVKEAKSVPQTWLCFILADQGFRLLYPILHRTKNVGHTFSNMGGQTVKQCWIKQSQLCSMV